MKRRLTAMLLSAAIVLSLTAFPAGAADSDGEDEYEGILEEYAETSAGFFYWLSVTEGDSDAYNAYLLLTTGAYGSTDITGSLDGGYYASTELGDEEDATSLENLQATIQWMEKCNELRQSDDNSSGLSSLKVSSLLMAIAELDVNWSCTNINPAGVFGASDQVDGENLAYGYADPFDSWYTEEKEVYDSGADGDTEQYENIISSSYEATGFAICTKGRYSITCSQVFSSSSSCALYTVAEYEDLLEEYAVLAEEYLSCRDGHSWSSPVWTWSSDFSTASATFTCTECGKEETVEASVSSRTEEATCTESGETIHTASVTFEGTTCTDTQSIELPAAGHSYDDGVVTREATETEDGVLTYTCTVCGDSYTEVIPAGTETEDDAGSEAGCIHDFDVIWSYDGSGYSEASVTLVCSICGETIELEADISEEITSEATCTEDGIRIYTATAEYEGETYSMELGAEIISATGHSYTYSISKAATCTENGLMIRTCTVCGQSSEIIIYTDGHTYGSPVWTWAEDYSSASAAFTCEVCGETATAEAEVESEDGEDGTTVYTATAVLEDSTYTDTRTLEYSMDYAVCQQDGDCLISSYSDADPAAWYHDGVHFCIENDLMNGTSTATFEPGTATTRAMVVTMLYRLAGSPDMSGSFTTFSDVVAGSWYVDAVIWAERTGIAKGYDTGEFGVSDEVTREQLATFFYRYAEYAGLDVSASADLSSYPDAGEVSSWAETELSWAVAEGLITGQGSGSTSYLSPGSDAARSETATILMRFIVNIVME